MPRNLSSDLAKKVCSAVNRDRLVETAIGLVEVPSPTRSAGAVADRLAEILTGDGFAVERLVADWPDAPAVVTRVESGRPGPVLQFDGHLDTVHLPFVPPRHENGCLYGSGASDMKGGIAAFVEAARALCEIGGLQAGGVLLTAHDMHEGPWGDRRQLRSLISQGVHGDAVMLPEYFADKLPLAGRGMAIFEIHIRRDGEPVHEVLRPAGLPSVVNAGADLVVKLRDLDETMTGTEAAGIGRDSVFVGQIESGEIYNQAPVECLVRGTRRWVTPGTAAEVEQGFRELLEQHAQASGTRIDLDYSLQGDAFRIDEGETAVAAFQTAHTALTGAPLPAGAKPFLDDGNLFCSMAGVPALTHGPAATGAHTLNECVAVDELVRVARVYALTALSFCAETSDG